MLSDVTMSLFGLIHVPIHLESAEHFLGGKQAAEVGRSDVGELDLQLIEEEVGR